MEVWVWVDQWGVHGAYGSSFLSQGKVWGMLGAGEGGVWVDKTEYDILFIWPNLIFAEFMNNVLLRDLRKGMLYDTF